MTKTGKLSGFNHLTKDQIFEEKARLEKAGIRLDISNGKMYTFQNIPLGRTNSIKTASGKEYKIFAQNGNSDVWYHGKFVGDYYAVFVKTYGFWQQVSKWYFHFGNAVKYMCTISGAN